MISNGGDIDRIIRMKRQPRCMSEDGEMGGFYFGVKGTVNDLLALILGLNDTPIRIP